MINNENDIKTSRNSNSNVNGGGYSHHKTYSQKSNRNEIFLFKENHHYNFLNEILGIPLPEN